MKLQILPSATEDLSVGFLFYESQLKGLGGYFLESLFSDIDSLKLYAGIQQRYLGITVCIRNAFLMLSIIKRA